MVEKVCVVWTASQGWGKLPCSFRRGSRVLSWTSLVHSTVFVCSRGHKVVYYITAICTKGHRDDVWGTENTLSAMLLYQGPREGRFLTSPSPFSPPLTCRRCCCIRGRERGDVDPAPAPLSVSHYCPPSNRSTAACTLPCVACNARRLRVWMRGLGEG